VCASEFCTCKYVYLYVCMYIQHARKIVRAYACLLNACIFACMHVYMNVCVLVCMSVDMHAWCMYTSLCVHMYVRIVCMQAYMHTCMYA